jgi:hypothetical protein
MLRWFSGISAGAQKNTESKYYGNNNFHFSNLKGNYGIAKIVYSPIKLQFGEIKNAAIQLCVAA